MNVSLWGTRNKELSLLWLPVDWKKPRGLWNCTCFLELIEHCPTHLETPYKSLFLRRAYSWGARQASCQQGTGISNLQCEVFQGAQASGLTAAPIFQSPIKGAAWPASRSSPPLRRGHSGCELHFWFLTLLQAFCQAVNKHPVGPQKARSPVLVRLANPLAFGQCHLEPLALPAPASAPSPWLISIVGHHPSDPTVCSVFVSQWPLSAGIPGFTSCIETTGKMFRTVYWGIINPVCSQKTIKRDFCWIMNVACVTRVDNMLRPQTQAHHCL